MGTISDTIIKAYYVYIYPDCSACRASSQYTRFLSHPIYIKIYWQFEHNLLHRDHICNMLFGTVELPPTTDFHSYLRDGAMMETVLPLIRRGGVDTVLVLWYSCSPALLNLILPPYTAELTISSQTSCPQLPPSPPQSPIALAYMLSPLT